MSHNLADLFFMFSTLGEMGVKDVIAECHTQGWMPLLVFRPHDKNQPTLIPALKTREHAMQFGRRNLPKDQLFGAAILTPDDVANIQKAWVLERGWQIEVMDHPRLLKDLGTFDVEVYEPPQKPDVYGLAGKHGQRSKTLACSK